MNTKKAVDGIKRDLLAIPIKLKAKSKSIDYKKLIKNILPYVIFGYIFNKLSWLYGYTTGNVLVRMLETLNNFTVAFKNPLPSINPRDITVGILSGIILWLVVKYRLRNTKKYRKGVEYGSARWGNAKDIEPFIDPVFRNNIILTSTERLMCSFPSGGGQSFAKPTHPKYGRNKNLMIIGGSGTGKTRFVVKPNLMQMHSSYVLTDPKGTILVECGQMLKDAGYRIRVLNTINFSRSMKYNPFDYIKSEKDILKLVNTIMANTKGEGSQSGDDFWQKAERLYYTALIALIWYEAPEDEKNFSLLIDYLDASEVHEEDENFENAVDKTFKKLAKRDPTHFAVRQYKKFKLAAGKTAKSILVSCGARLAPFDIKELRDLTSEDEMHLDRLGVEKTALFVIISDTDDTFNFLVSIMYTQLFNILCEIADNDYNGKLPVHVRCILDEFANIGQIPKFEKLIATIRSREISAAIILQSKSQLKAIYKDNAETIIGNCDSTLFLGGNEKTTLKDLTEALGKETIDIFNTSDTRGASPSYGTNFQKTGKELMSQDELSVLDGGKCILQLRGVRPFLSDKYDITKHPMYKKLSDFNPKNAFDVEEFVKNPHCLIVRDEDVIDEVYEASVNQ